MQPDLTRRVDVEGMRTLSVPGESGALEQFESAVAPPGTEWREIEVGLEAAGAKKIRVLVSKPETFNGRTGYKADFIEGWPIPFPKPGSDDDVRTPRTGGSGALLNYQHFSTLQSSSRRMPMIVGVNIDGNRTKKITRENTPWRFDGRLNVEDQIGDEVYAEKKNVLDRGHMVRREDPNWGTAAAAGRANIDTFHFTNSCPQMAAVNQRVWLGLENYILHNTRDESIQISVFTGPVFRNKDLRYRGALIPRSFFKVVAVVNDDGRPSATAYEVSQEDELSELEFVFGAYKTFQTSIRSIEEKTGLTFGDLSEYDGFSVSEKKGRPRRRVELESLEMVRI